jgi:hypothetical protein
MATTEFEQCIHKFTDLNPMDDYFDETSIKNECGDDTTVISESSQFAVIGLTTVDSPVKVYGKFSDRLDAINYARKLWNSYDMYSIHVGSYCSLTSKSPNAIYKCNETQWSAKR